MKIEDLKQLWYEHDKKLTENLKTNREIIKRMQYEKAKTLMDTTKNYELISLLFILIFLIYSISSSIKFSSDIKLLISGVLTSIWFVIMLVLAIGKLKHLLNLDFYDQPILTVQKNYNRFRKKYFDSKKIETLSGVLFIIVATPLIGKVLAGADVFEYPVAYFSGVILALVVGHPISQWIYKNWYEKKLKHTENLLNELKNFESE